MEETFVYCYNVAGLLQMMACIYDPTEWQIFIDSSKASLKSVLLHNGNRYASIPIGHSVYLKETYKNMKILLRKIKYDKDKWMLCGDLKVLSMLLGQQGGIPNTHAFCIYGTAGLKMNIGFVSNGPKRNEFTVGEKNIRNESLVPPDKVILPPLHIKLGLIKQYRKSLEKGGECFKYICQKFSFLSYEKMKAGVFDGPKRRQLLKDKECIATMSPEEKNGWIACSQVVNNFLGNTKSPKYKEIVKTSVWSKKSAAWWSG